MTDVIIEALTAEIHRNRAIIDHNVETLQQVSFLVKMNLKTRSVRAVIVQVQHENAGL